MLSRPLIGLGKPFTLSGPPEIQSPAARGEQIPGGAEGYAPSAFLSEAAQLLPASRVPQSDFPRFACRRENFALGVEGNAPEPGGSFQGVKQFHARRDLRVLLMRRKV